LLHDGVVHGLAGGFFPHNGRFALVGDTNCGDVFRINADAEFCVGEYAYLGTSDFHRVMFNPTWFRENLRELFLSALDDVSLLVKNDCAGTYRALINRE
jgi:hypothetical protein